jgi:uncharacterized membrane protein
VLSIVGFALIIWGYGAARQDPVPAVGQPMVWTRHLASLLTLLAFVLLARPTCRATASRPACTTRWCSA